MMKVEYAFSNYDLTKPKFQWKAARKLLQAESKGLIDKIEFLAVPNSVLSKVMLILSYTDKCG